jgi:hypothetical protein
MLIAGGLAVAGGIAGIEARRSQLLNARLSRTRTSSLSRDPLRVAMLERHAARLQPLIPDIESILNRRLAIEALPAEELYANYTIDLLQQTGRYDVVSMNDSWIPYFGRRGYLTAVPDLESNNIRSASPDAISTAATGVDGTELVAYPWTFDFTLSAVRAVPGLQEWSERWSKFFPQIEPVGTLSVALGDSRTAAETFRAVMLSFGEDLVDPVAHEPTLTTYAGGRALETTLRLARASDAQAPLARDFPQLVTLAASGSIDIAPVIWASDSKPLWTAGQWQFGLVPAGRENRAWTNATLWMWGVPAGAPALSVARRFVQLLTTTEMQLRLWSETGLLPATRPALNGAWDPGGTDARNLVLNAIDHAQFAPVLRSFRTVSQIVGRLVRDAVTGNDSSDRIRRAANDEMRAVLVQEGELND